MMRNTTSHYIFSTQPQIPPTWKDSLFFRCLLLSLSKLFCFSSSSSFSRALMCSSKQIRASSLSMSGKRRGSRKDRNENTAARGRADSSCRPCRTLELLVLGEGGVVHQVLLRLRPRGAVGDVGHVVQNVLQSFPVSLSQLLGLFLREKGVLFGFGLGGNGRCCLRNVGFIFY